MSLSELEDEARELIRARPGFAIIVAELVTEPNAVTRAGLTRRESEALSFIRAYVAASDGVSPSYAEIAAAIGLKAKSGVHRIVVRLEQRGHLRRLAGRARSLAVKG
jgi:DNA-binding MarR family transcriptional regulator